MNVVVVVLLIEAGPISALLGVVFPRCQLDPLPGGPPRRRRSRFWLRFAGVFIALFFPLLVGLVARPGEQFAALVLMSGLPWGILVVALSRFVLFDGPGFDPGSADGDDDGPGPGGGWPTPPAPIGGFRSSTQNLPRRVCATIARRDGARVPVDRFASVSASRHGCGRSGRGRRGVPSERAPQAPRETVAVGYNQPRLRGPDARARTKRSRPTLVPHLLLASSRCNHDRC